MIRMVYGIGYKEHTLNEAAKIYGLSKARMRQIRNGAIRKLQNSKELKEMA